MITRVEQDEIEGENVYSEGYYPSQEQFDRYLAREVELAKQNMKLAAAAGHAVTLHSWSTTFEAVTGIKVERKPLLDSIAVEAIASGRAF